VECKIIYCGESALRCAAEVLYNFYIGVEKIAIKARGKNINNAADAALIATRIFKGIELAEASISSIFGSKRLSEITILLKRNEQLEENSDASLIEYFLEETGIPLEEIAREKEAILEEWRGDPSGILLYIICVIERIRHELSCRKNC